MDRTEVAAALSGRRYKTIDVFGVSLRIRSLNSVEASQWVSSRLDDAGNFNTDRAELARQRLIALCWVDDSGALVCPKTEDLGLIASWDESAVKLAYDECLVHMTAPRESIAKNSLGASGSSSPTCSPAPSLPDAKSHGTSTP